MRCPKVFLVLALTPVATLAPGLSARAQETLENCEWVFPSGEFNRTVTGGNAVTRVSTPNLMCPDGTHLQADSARYFEATDYYQFFGNVFFQDTLQTLRATDAAQLDRRAGRLQAQGNVRLERGDGSRITGESLVHQQAREGRGELLTVVGGRPNALLYPERRDGSGQGPRTLEEAPPGDSAAARDATPAEGERPTPYDVTADRIEIEGETRFRAVGEAVIIRDSLTAIADEADFDQDQGVLNLHGSTLEPAIMTGPDYELEGESIRADILLDVVRQVVARRRARLTGGGEMILRAPLITLDLEDGVLERLLAQQNDQAAPPEEGAELPPIGPAIFEVPHPPRPVAVAEDFLMVADEIEIFAPEEVLDSVVARGNARGESLAREALNTEDTPAIARRDWMEGQTITARFGRVEVPDTTRGAPEGAMVEEYRLERLVAETRARSLYRMLPQDTASAADSAAVGDSAAVAGAAPPEEPASQDSLAARGQEAAPADSVPPTPPDNRLALHYVTGDRITLVLVEGEVSRMEVAGLTRGVHFEPRPRGGGVVGPTPAGGREAP